jgi:DNA-binding beta-propeller fold protein YncE
MLWRGSPSLLRFRFWISILAPALGYAQGIITTVAGTAWVPPTQPAAALSVPVGPPSGVAVDVKGNVYFSDTGSSAVMRLAPDHTLSLFAGDGVPAFSGDGGMATASLSNPQGLALDSEGNLYIADFGNNRVRKVTPNGTISTFAGNGSLALASGSKPTAFLGGQLPAACL